MGYRGLLKQYEEALATQDFSQIKPLISDEAVFWFNDGSFEGLREIEEAFDTSFSLIKEERYWISDENWVCVSDDNAVCVYQFNWEGLIDGDRASGFGRGTSVLSKINGEWKIVHEHLSAVP